MTNLYDKISWLEPDQQESNFYLVKIKCICNIVSINLEIISTERVLSEDDFILGNLDVSGFYRVNYDINNWNLIIKQLLINKDVML